MRAVDISSTPVGAKHVSDTFHGRDLMAPAAAHLAARGEWERLGPAVHQVTVAARLAARLQNGAGEGRILHIDAFGNAITNLRARETAARSIVSGADFQVQGPAPHYQAETADGAARALLITGSSGYLEIAWPNGSAAECLDLERGDSVRVRPA